MPTLFTATGRLDSRRCLTVLDWFERQADLARRFANDGVERAGAAAVRPATKDLLAELPLVECVLLLEGLPRADAGALLERIERELSLALPIETLALMDTLRAWLREALTPAPENAFRTLIR